MNPILVDRHQEGLQGLRDLLLGKHLRPRNLALMVAAFVAEPAAAVQIINDMEVSDGEDA